MCLWISPDGSVTAAVQVSWRWTAEVPAQHRRQRLARGALPGRDLVGWLDLAIAQEPGPMDLVREYQKSQLDVFVSSFYHALPWDKVHKLS